MNTGVSVPKRMAAARPMYVTMSSAHSECIDRYSSAAPTVGQDSFQRSMVSVGLASHFVRSCGGRFLEEMAAHAHWLIQSSSPNHLLIVHSLRELAINRMASSRDAPGFDFYNGSQGSKEEEGVRFGSVYTLDFK